MEVIIDFELPLFISHMGYISTELSRIKGKKKKPANAFCAFFCISGIV